MCPVLPSSLSFSLFASHGNTKAVRPQSRLWCDEQDLQKAPDTGLLLLAPLSGHLSIHHPHSLLGTLANAILWCFLYWFPQSFPPP